MSCKTVSVRRLPRRLDRRAGNVSASLSALKALAGAFVVFTQVGCLNNLLDGSEDPEVGRQSGALVYGQLRGSRCVQADQETLGSYALYAASSIAIGANSSVLGGDVGVRNPTIVSGSPRLLLEARSSISSTNKAVAASIRAFNRVSLGKLETDELTKGSNVNHGVVTAFPDTTPIPPEVASPAAGGPSVSVPGVERTLAEGTYNNVRVGDNKILRLSGGTYVFNSLRVGDSAQLIVEGANTVVTVLHGILMRRYAVVTVGPGLSAKDFILQTPAATADLNEDLVDDPAVDVAPDTTVRALVLAPNAWLRFGNDSTFTGAAIFDRGGWGTFSEVNFEDGIPGEDCLHWQCGSMSWDDGNPCTTDTCDLELGVQHATLPDGTTCTQPGVEASACLASVCEELCINEQQTREGDPLPEDPNDPTVSRIVKFDEYPTLSGHYLVKYKEGCMKYNPLFFYSVQAVADGEYTWFLVGNDDRSNQIAVLPGTIGFFPGQGPTPRDQPGFQSFDACVTANRALPPIVVLHTDDSTLGIHLADHPYSDNREGDGMVNPTWTITPFGACGQ